jgi:hypothetical protein
MIDDPREPKEGDQTEIEQGDDTETPPEEETEELEEPEHTQQQQVEPPLGRLERRDQGLRDRLQEVHAAEERLRIRLQEADQREQRFNQPDPRIEAERIANMPLEEQISYRNQQQINALRGENIQNTFHTRAELDKLRYEQTVAAAPAYRKYSDEVERQYWSQHNNALRQGNPNLILSRDTILTQLVGMDVRKNGEKALRTARETGQRNIQKATTKAGNVSGNVRPSRQEKSPAEAAADRMRAAGVLTD